MGDADRRVRRVHALATGAGRGRGLDLEVLLRKLNLDLVRLRQNGHGRRGGVYAPLALRLRHPLNPVHPALELELGIGTGALDLGPILRPLQPQSRLPPPVGLPVGVIGPDKLLEAATLAPVLSDLLRIAQALGRRHLLLELAIATGERPPPVDHAALASPPS